MGNPVAWYILLVAGVIVLSALLRVGMMQLKVSALVGYFLLGFLLRVSDEKCQWLGEEGYQIFAFMAEMGIVVLLFRVGLESKVARLVKWLPKASVIFVGDVLGSGLLGYLGAYYLLFALKLAAFGAFCVVFSRYAERHVTAFFQKLHAGSGALLVVLGIGIMVAAGAELLGFSAAIGAFFAGLIFSRDPESVKLDVSFESLHDLFAPFFFVGIGLQVDLVALTAGAAPVVVLLVVAVAGKVIGNGGTTWLLTGTSAAVLLGVSMIPRAEIALIVMQRGLELGDWAVPLVLRGLFKRWPQAQEVV